MIWTRASGLECVLFEFFHVLDPIGMNSAGRVGFGVESGHNHPAHGFCFAGLGFNHALLHADAFGADVRDLSPNVYVFAEECGLEEVYVHVCHYEVEIVHVDFPPCDCGEIVDFGEVHEHEVNVVVEVPEHIDVGEAYLHRHAVAEGEGRGDNPWV